MGSEKKKASKHWTEGFPNSLNVGDKIEAELKHINKRLKMKNKILVLTATEDGFYIDDGPDELSYNWDVVRWRKA